MLTVMAAAAVASTVMTSFTTNVHRTIVYLYWFFFFYIIFVNIRCDIRQFSERKHSKFHSFTLSIIPFFRRTKFGENTLHNICIESLQFVVIHHEPARHQLKSKDCRIFRCENLVLFSVFFLSFPFSVFRSSRSTEVKLLNFFFYFGDARGK